VLTLQIETSRVFKCNLRLFHVKPLKALRTVPPAGGARIYFTPVLQISQPAQ